MQTRLHRQTRIIAGVLLMIAPAAYLTGRAVQSLAPLASARHAPPLTAAEAPKLVEILVATHRLERGDAIRAEDIGHLQIAGTAPADSLTDPRSAEFHVAIEDIGQGQLITRGAVSTAPADAGLAVLIPPGMRAVALGVSAETAVGDFIRPGDRADLIATFTSGGAAPGAEDEREARIVLQDVELLAVGDDLSAGDAHGQAGGGAADRAHKAAGIRIVTLAVTPAQAAQLALIRAVARYDLALRNRRDTQPVGAMPARVSDLLGIRAPAAVRPEPRRAAGHSVETLIGQKLERVQFP